MARVTITQLRAQIVELQQAGATLRAENDRLRDIAFTDGLMKLLKREPVLDRLMRELKVSQAASKGKRAPHNGVESLAVVSCDLVGFKAVNDVKGHGAGDTVLVQTATALTKAVRMNDLVSRWGGDEFLLVLWNISPEDVLTVLDRALRNVREIEGVDIRMGCAIWKSGSAPVNPQTLVDIADRNERDLHKQGKRGYLLTICE